MSLHHGCNANICIAFTSSRGLGFARADLDWDNAQDEDWVHLQTHPECLPLSLEGYTIDTDTGAATDCDLGWVCGYASALDALEQELSVDEWWGLSPAAFAALCKRFEVGAYERPAC